MTEKTVCVVEGCKQWAIRRGGNCADHKHVVLPPKRRDVEPDWSRGCVVCGAKPVMPITDMCGPCTFGEAGTAGGNW